eukprot:995709-Rhodomonas_salina.1
MSGTRIIAVVVFQWQIYCIYCCAVFGSDTVYQWRVPSTVVVYPERMLLRRSGTDALYQSTSEAAHFTTSPRGGAVPMRLCRVSSYLSATPSLRNAR